MVGEEKKEEANALFDQVADLSHVQEVEEEVMEAYAKRPRAPLAVTKETILATIDSGDADYLRANRLTKKKSINLQHTRQLHGAFSTVERNVAGKKRLVSATVLARAIYRFAAAPTTEAATAQYAIVRVLLTYCGVMRSSEKEGLLHFITVDGWRMARKTPEARDDPSPHSPLKRRVLLAEAALGGGHDLARREGQHHRGPPGLYRLPVTASQSSMARCSTREAHGPADQ